ncbi:threonine-phosphate decarboxylase CobD [Fodinisporobacter ferrooxydans]|uniref:threonine-phosphate decarboxylase n=1 Tax=Fodinisporobacter ferrooxydans TaxID=2901836 RepID=A0ABY4CIF9_9BACL|nr:threonine-phosphate decarboxylase CobD [Alicyclobacillaceae bacterium MYW30-H2]
MGILETFGHGGDITTAAEVFGIPSSQMLDFSANINPLGPPARIMEKLPDLFRTIVHYPDSGQRMFRRVLAERLQIDQAQLLAGNGAAECMALALQGLAPARVGVVYPCFSEYEQLANAYQIPVSSCLGREENHFRPDMKELRRLIETTDLVFLGHPNNPTGMLYTQGQLEQMAEWAKRYHTYLVIDEAFLDFVEPAGQPTLFHQISNNPKIVLIRSMTKFYAIPGLRLGYTIAHPSVIQQMKRKQVPWSVNQLALAVGTMCLAEQEYETVTRRLIQNEREHLCQSMRKHFGWQVWEGAANFLLTRLPSQVTAEQFQWNMGRKGILIRSCADYPGLTIRDVRFAVRTRGENDKLLDTISKVLREVCIVL